ncbi:hypothetical protein EYF80_016844 [Liparis tanakae]|uniref:Uncharacterized protein n=1 Tax=Liparis tanakae TaxID=230148 RepID=A0A4Z2I624_9TELE|nr:hypothetical protein EYF80_016844 [Liparis tanakae]
MSIKARGRAESQDGCHGNCTQRSHQLLENYPKARFCPKHGYTYSSSNQQIHRGRLRGGLLQSRRGLRSLPTPHFASMPSSKALSVGRFLKIARQVEAHRATISTSPVHAAKRITHGGISSGFSPKSTPSSERSSPKPLDSSSFRRVVSSLNC